MICEFIKDNQEQCKSQALEGDRYCFWHSEKVSDKEKKEARAKGGENRKTFIDKPLPKVKIENIKDIVKLLANTTNRVMSGDLDLKTATTLGNLSNVMIKALEQSDTEKRLEELEDKILAIRQ